MTGKRDLLFVGNVLVAEDQHEHHHRRYGAEADDGLGVRGIRFNLVQDGATTPEIIEPLSKQVNDSHSSRFIIKLDDSIWTLTTSSRSHLDFGWPSRSIAECHKPRYFEGAISYSPACDWRIGPKSSIPLMFSASRPSAVCSGYRRASRTAASYVEALSRGAAARLAYWRETAQADGHPSRRLSGCRVLSTRRAAPPSSGSDRRSRRHRQERWRGLPRHGRGRAGRTVNSTSSGLIDGEGGSGRVA